MEWHKLGRMKKVKNDVKKVKNRTINSQDTYICDSERRV
jgi:hypothetical protein